MLNLDLKEKRSNQQVANRAQKADFARFLCHWFLKLGVDLTFIALLGRDLRMFTNPQLINQG